MKRIDHFNLWSFDLNLLVAFDAMMRERSVTRAAARLRLGQPAMSHNLSTLRVLLQDELFLRKGAVMVPTPRAHALAEPVQRILAEAQGMIASPERFDPLADTRTFRIGFSSEMEVTLMPRLAALLREAAPGLHLLARTARPDEVHRLLDEGAIDVGVGGYGEGGRRHRREVLFERTLSCCFSAARLGRGAPLDRQDYLTLPHVLVSHDESIEGCLDWALKRLNLELNVALAAPEFLTALDAAARAPLLATLPSRVVKDHAARFGLTASPVPLEIEVRPIAMVWPGQADREPSAAWLRDQIRLLMREK